MIRFIIIPIVVLTLLLPLLTASAQTEIAGPVSGEWTRDGSPYIVVDSTWVPEGDSLAIGSGVDVFFDPDMSLAVFGAISANGTEEDSVRFMAHREDESWNGIQLFGQRTFNCFSYFKSWGAAVSYELSGAISLILDYSDISSVGCPIVQRGEGLRLTIRNSQIIGGRCIDLQMANIFGLNSIIDAGNNGGRGIYLSSFGSINLSDCIVYGGTGWDESCGFSFSYCQFLIKDGFSDIYIGVSGNDALMDNCLVEGQVVYSQNASIINSQIMQGVASRAGTSLTMQDCQVGNNVSCSSGNIDINHCLIGGGVNYTGSGDNVSIKHSICYCRYNNLYAIDCPFNDSEEQNINVEYCLLWRGINYNRFNGYVYNNTIISDSIQFPLLRISGNRNSSSIINNIFFIREHNNGIFNINRFAMDQCNIEYNCCFGYNSLNWPDEIPELELSETNILLNPCLTISDSSDIRLTFNSPCIDAGDPESSLDPDSTRADIGANYYHHLNGGLPKETPLDYEFCISPPSPNPVNGVFKIMYNIPVGSEIGWMLFNTLGRQVAYSPIQIISSGHDQIVVNCATLSTGLYFMCLHAQNSEIIVFKVQVLR